MKIGIVNDTPMMVEVLRRVIAESARHELIWIARDGEQAVQMCAWQLPDVVLMDLLMPKMDGVEATRRIKQEAPSVGILFFSVFTDYVEASVAAGADGYLTKDCSPTELYDEIRRIASVLKVPC